MSVRSMAQPIKELVCQQVQDTERQEEDRWDQQ